MKTASLKKKAAGDVWPHKVEFGRESVSIYRRKTPQGNFAYMVANYSTRDASGKKIRRFDSYPTEQAAIDAAKRLAKQMSQLDVISASMTKEQTIEYASVIQTLQPLNIPLTSAVSTIADAVKIVGDLSAVIEAAKFFKARNKIVTPKLVAEAIGEMIAIKEQRNVSPRYIQDLRNRLNRFAMAFQKETSRITTADLQAWFDAKKFTPGNYIGFRRVIHLFFEFAVARGYAVDNPASAMEKVKAKHGATEIFTPKEISRLLSAASIEYRPCLAIGAFAGLRSAEIERLEWSDIDLEGGHIIVGADKAKTASRRVVPICDTLRAWLAPLVSQGKVWKGGHDEFYEAQQAAAAATAIEANPEHGISEQPAVKWKANALRHSYQVSLLQLACLLHQICGFRILDFYRNGVLKLCGLTINEFRT